MPSTGNGGYFNIQHILKNQWALECYFNSTGGGYLSVGGQEYNFSSPTNAWFPIEFDVDMDNDQATLTINNVAVHTWPFSYQQGNTNGVNQLAGINFYAGAPNNATGTYYVDDFIGFLEKLRLKYLETNDKRYWKELIRILPESWLQTRAWSANYSTLRSIIHWRRGHKLSEWAQFINWCKELPYAEELLFYAQD